MKTILKTLVIVLFGMISITSCNNKKTPSSDKGVSETLPAAIDSLKGHKAIVVYFSRAGENYMVGNVKKGNTAFLADYISEFTDSPIYEIRSEDDYESKSYEEMLRIVRDEQENGVMPDYSTELTEKDLDGIDVVFIGSPIWWGTFPRIFLSFFKDFDLNGKKLVPFITNQGSGMGNTVEDLKSLYPNADVMGGFCMLGTDAREPEARETVAEWLGSLSYEFDTTPKVGNDNRATDGYTGATKMICSLTSSGKALENIEKETVEVRLTDGSIKKLTLVVNGAVDMDGITWCVSNLGASKPWEIGNHYAWGETEPKKSYTEHYYKYLNKNIGSDISGTCYDAATKEYGGSWRMPTTAQWHKLLFGSELEWVKIKGVSGYLFTAKNGNKLFFPGNGYKFDTETGTPNEGFYWSSNSSNLSNAQVTYLPENSWGISNYGRYIGIGIRAIE